MMKSRTNRDDRGRCPCPRKRRSDNHHGDSRRRYHRRAQRDVGEQRRRQNFECSVSITIDARQRLRRHVTIGGIDDAIVDGTQTVTVTASAAAHADGTHTLDVTDDEDSGLSRDDRRRCHCRENGGATTATVTRNTDTTAS